MMRAVADKTMNHLLRDFAALLDDLVAAGLTNQQALTAATRAPCAWLKTNCGAIAPGMRAMVALLVAVVRAEPRIHDCVPRPTPRDSPVRSLDLWKT